MNTQQVILKQYPDGMPKPTDFEIVSRPLEGEGKVICRTRYLSLDPYMRSQIAGRHISGTISPGDVMRGETVSEVVDPGSSDFSAGDLVRCFGGWQSHSAHDPAELSRVSAEITPLSYALSLLGMTGLTAWAGMVWQAGVKEGDQVLIPAVTGGVGAAAARICQLHGARVVGTAGSDEKCRAAVEELGIDACINRKTENMAERLDELFPDGIDVYFDLVGGELLTLASERLALNARAVLAGLMSEYNNPERAMGPPPGFWIRARATVYGLVVYDFEPRRDEFINACLPWVKDGSLSQREDISRGLEAAPEAFCRLMRGENHGKVIVQLD